MAEPILPTDLLQNAAAAETMVNKATEKEKGKTKRSQEMIRQYYEQNVRSADEVSEIEEIEPYEQLPESASDEDRNRRTQPSVVFLGPHNQELPTTEEALPIIEESQEDHQTEPTPDEEEMKEEYQQQEPLNELGNKFDEET